jgi:outer membrane protein OmpA-like peptidoglycan-associated protein
LPWWCRDRWHESRRSRDAITPTPAQIIDRIIGLPCQRRRRYIIVGDGRTTDGMYAWLVSMIIVGVGFAAAHADPTPARFAVHESKADCGRKLSCAEQFADALSSPSGVPATLRIDSIIAYAPGSNRVYSRDREKLQSLAASWRTHARWSTITVVGHAGTGYHTALAQQRADRIRAYLIRYGVTAEHVIALGQDDARGAVPGAASAARVDLAIEVCDRLAKACARHAAVDAPRAAP